MPRAATSRQVFRAQLVLVDATGSGVLLKHSRRHGELVLDAGAQSAQLVYPRVGRFFQRRFEQPLKCVLGRKLLRIYSSNGKRSFTWDRWVSTVIGGRRGQVFGDAPQLRRYGLEVEVIALGESMLSTAEDQRVLVVQDAAVIAGAEAALQAIREASPRSMQAEIRDYEESSQLRDDTEAIVRSMFSMDT